ncbi:NAD(P)/FAD-dependent oxidoreductase [Nocardioides euryhalodurans]|uniref:NAD(P)/FAD-dependent oxidoreductase n=1 Tax=Nocardioides euryhalodurans TaxID=2518370 RepID=A0A4P7GNS3_9ACTN|nr:NAD(P)/FAD-dependent oxidoreductase [Nocardioides euryhalodurans]QBR93865.1 NAD(P)/FAD-dependent oxidoreductase [Nocardioides euryhalodurans]
MTRYDVVIVGGRVAGASTALLLARAGLRVAVLDRSGHGTDTLSTHGLMRAGVLQLSRWGMLQPLIDAGTPPVHRTTFHYDDGESVQVSIRHAFGVGALYAPRRHLLDRVLVDAAAEAGADVLHQTSATGLLRDGTGRVTGVRARDRHGASLVLPATFSVGADGIRSWFAREVGAPVVRQGRSASAVLYRYVADLPADGYEWAYLDGAAAGLIPTNDGQTCVFVGTTPARMRTLRRNGPESAMTALVEGSPGGRPLADRLRRARPVGRMHGWGGTPGFVRHSHGRGWALVGDAGYFKDPITTHGMTDALRDAELLATAVLATVGGATAETTALRRYQDTRDRLSRALFSVTEQVAAYDWDGDRVRTLLRQVSSAMSDEVDHLDALPADRWMAPGPSKTPADRAVVTR